MSSFYGLQKSNQIGVLQSLNDLYLSWQEFLKIIFRCRVLAYDFDSYIPTVYITVGHLKSNKCECKLLEIIWGIKVMRRFIPELWRTTQLLWSFLNSSHDFLIRFFYLFGFRYSVYLNEFQACYGERCLLVKAFFRFLFILLQMHHIDRNFDNHILTVMTEIFDGPLVP